MRELRAWAERLAATAVEMRAERGQCPPTALLVVDRVPLSMDAVLGSDDDKRTLRALFEVAARGGAEACGLVAEGWRFGGNERKLQRAMRHALDGQSLADLPDRREILFVHVVSAIAEVLHVFEITKRAALKRVRSEPSGAGILSRFLTALPWAPGKKRNRRALDARANPQRQARRRRRGSGDDG